LFRQAEQVLARHTDVLVAVSQEVRDDLVRLGVAPAQQFVILPLGFDLAPFTDDSDRPRRREALRREWQIASEDELVTLVARLVPIKRVDRFLRVAKLLSHRPRTRFVVVGDGELREQLRRSPEAHALDDRLRWVGFRRDMADVYFASDVVVLTSDNEGTPVSLIEAQAAAVPVVAPDVGGVRSAVWDDQTGLVVAVDDEPAFARAIESILDDAHLSARLAQAGRAHAAQTFTLQRLVKDHDDLYRRALGSTPSP
jgi:glycosyltransferase involved in cell wall biosynthesis